MRLTSGPKTFAQPGPDIRVRPIWPKCRVYQGRSNWVHPSNLIHIYGSLTHETQLVFVSPIAFLFIFVILFFLSFSSTADVGWSVLNCVTTCRLFTGCWEAMDCMVRSDWSAATGSQVEGMHGSGVHWSWSDGYDVCGPACSRLGVERNGFEFLECFFSFMMTICPRLSSKLSFFAYLIFTNEKNQ